MLWVTPVVAFPVVEALVLALAFVLAFVFPPPADASTDR